MGEKKIKQQMDRAVDILSRQYNSDIFTKIKIKDSDCPFHLEVFRKSKKKGDEVLKFRVTLDVISELDIKLCENYPMPEGIFTKFIACKTGRGRNNWKLKPIS